MGMTEAVIMLLALAVGLAGGYIWGRNASALSKQKQALEDQMQQQQREFDNYRLQVNQHFSTTANLINNMTSSYRAVFEHLVQGAQRLATTDRTKVEMEDSAHDMPPDAAPSLYASRPLHLVDADDLEMRLYDAEAAAFKAVVSSVDHAPQQGGKKF